MSQTSQRSAVLRKGKGKEKEKEKVEVKFQFNIPGTAIPTSQELRWGF